MDGILPQRSSIIPNRTGLAEGTCERLLKPQDTVILEIGLTFKHLSIVCWAHHQELSVVLLLNEPPK